MQRNTNRLGRTFALGLLLLAGVGVWAADDNAEARMKKDITYLASDECEGRGVSTKGINLAADYVAAEFAKAGLKPANGAKDYFQPFNMTGTAKLEGANTLKLKGPDGQEIELEINKGFRPLAMSGSGKVEAAPVVFLGYGATAKDINYDDYKDLDVKGKVIIVIRRTPRYTDQNAPFDGEKTAHHAALQTKLQLAEEHKAAAMILVNDRESGQNSDPLIDFAYTASAPSASKPLALHVRRSIVDGILDSALSTNLRSIEEDMDRDLKNRSAVLSGWTATIETNVRRPALAVKNIVGVLEGAGPLANETVVIGAHYDHLGYGGMGSLAKGLKGPTIHHGADDNGSGTTTLMEIARRFGAQKKREGRRLVFIAFSGEESGLLGSEAYCKNPLYPLAETVAMVNLDMVGRLRSDDKTKKDKLTVYGTGTAKGFDELIESINKKFEFQMQKVPGGMGPSDHASFYQRKIPVFFFFTGDHPDYHRPTDTADKINVAGMKKIADLTTEVVENLSTVADKPQYLKVASPVSPSASGPRIGIRPDYGTDKEGVLISAVSDGGPAAKAGMQGGDLITEVGGKAAKDLQTYMVLMSKYKKGDKVPLTVVRDEKKMTITVVPE